MKVKLSKSDQIALTQIQDRQTLRRLRKVDNDRRRGVDSRPYKRRAVHPTPYEDCNRLLELIEHLNKETRQ